MVDVESHEEAYGGSFAKQFRYGSAYAPFSWSGFDLKRPWLWPSVLGQWLWSGFDLNRLLNATAVWSIIIFLLWICWYWILQYVPMPLALSVPGSKENDYKYNVVIDAMKTAVS